MVARQNPPIRCGLHLDALTTGKTILSRVDWLERTVRAISEDIGMRLLSLSTAHIAEEIENQGRVKFADEGGYSVQALISTSHIALHTWPNRNYFMFDCVSCRPFDHARMRMLLHEYFGIREVLYEHIYPKRCPSAVLADKHVGSGQRIEMGAS